LAKASGNEPVNARAAASPGARVLSRPSQLGRRLLLVGARFILVVIACVAAALGLFEIIYRWQVIDTYRPELKAFNEARSLSGEDARPAILILGDSFTAGTDSYAALLREKLPAYRVINGGLTGTGILEAGIVAPGRFRRFAPKIFIYQIYVGNDLFNLRYDIHWGKASPWRNIYWIAAQRLRGLGFLNYRAGQIHAGWRARDGAPPLPPPDVEPGPFDPARYNLHERRYLEADPWFLEDQILLLGARRADYQVLLDKLGRLLDLCREPGCRSYLLAIPHACQVDQLDFDKITTVGGRFRHPQSVSDLEYPFLSGLRSALKRRGLGEDRLIDPLPALRASEEAGDRVYYLHDPHLNSRGQRILADLIQSRLAAE
jgi:hypothetical protein